MTGLATIRILVISLAVTSLIGGNAYAAKDEGDYFGRSTGSTSSLPPAPMPIQPQQQPSLVSKSPTVLWFESFDRELVTHFPNEREKIELARDFGDPPQLERVMSWTYSCSQVSKRYRDLSRVLKTMSIPPSMSADPQSSNVVAYKQLLSEWYGDSAAYLEDWIKPRTPARTVEELDAQLDQMQKRSERLKGTLLHLHEMDSKIRDHFHVHPLDDAIWKYAKKPLEQHK